MSTFGLTKRARAMATLIRQPPLSIRVGVVRSSCLKPKPFNTVSAWARMAVGSKIVSRSRVKASSDMTLTQASASSSVQLKTSSAALTRCSVSRSAFLASLPRNPLSLLSYLATRSHSRRRRNSSKLRNARVAAAGVPASPPARTLSSSLSVISSSCAERTASTALVSSPMSSWATNKHWHCSGNPGMSLFSIARSKDDLPHPLRPMKP
mmetsp:Transcript_56545/g.132636  ORF Transcript_56545/g.132636 Transcript_56545/m.132636 type:complete len:209 (+) Transcript_56545:1470-2096(+)